MKTLLHVLLMAICHCDVVHYHFDGDQEPQNHDFFYGGNMANYTPAFVLHDGHKVVLKQGDKFINDEFKAT